MELALRMKPWYLFLILETFFSILIDSRCSLYKFMIKAQERTEGEKK